MTDKAPTSTDTVSCPRTIGDHFHPCWMCGWYGPNPVPKEIVAAYRLGGRLAVMSFVQSRPHQYPDLYNRLLKLHVISG